MSNEVKTSKEILDAFFDEISKRDDLHKPTRDALVELYNQKKLTKTNATNALSKAREGHHQDDKN